jgi:hypothetical protein
MKKGPHGPIATEIRDADNAVNRAEGDSFGNYAAESEV